MSKQKAKGQVSFTERLVKKKSQGVSWGNLDEIKNELINKNLKSQDAPNFEIKHLDDSRSDCSKDHEEIDPLQLISLGVNSPRFTDKKLLKNKLKLEFSHTKHTTARDPLLYLSPPPQKTYDQGIPKSVTVGLLQPDRSPGAFHLSPSKKRPNPTKLQFMRPKPSTPQIPDIIKKNPAIPARFIDLALEQTPHHRLQKKINEILSENTDVLRKTTKGFQMSSLMSVISESDQTFNPNFDSGGKLKVSPGHFSGVSCGSRGLRLPGGECELDLLSTSLITDKKKRIACFERLNEMAQTYDQKFRIRKLKKMNPHGHDFGIMQSINILSSLLDHGNNENNLKNTRNWIRMQNIAKQKQKFEVSVNAKNFLITRILKFLKSDSPDSDQEEQDRNFL
jgi:hypothetical protein